MWQELVLNNELKRLGRERFESEQLRTNLPALDKHYDWRCRIMIMMTRRRGMVMMVMVMVDKHYDCLSATMRD